MDTAAATARWLEFDQEVELAALTADGALLVVANRDTLALYETDSGAERWRAPLPAPPVRLALSATAVAAALLTSADTTTLASWSTDRPEPPRLLHGGQYAALHLALDATGRLLVSGLTGPRAAAGVGAPLRQLLHPDRDLPLWEQSALPFEPDHVLLNSAGHLLAHTRRQLTLVGREAPLLLDADLETVAVSPNGHFAAWFWGRGPTALARVRVARLADGAPVSQASTFDLGAFPTLAVDDRGWATLACGRRPDRVHLLRLPPGGAFTESQIQVHHV